MSRTGSSLVNVHSKLTVVSDTPVEHGKTYPFSILDHAMGLHTLHIVFYYRYDRPESDDLGRLRESLSKLLTLYPTVTGRLRRRAGGEDGNWEVNCNDAGVRVLVAKVDTTLDEWLRSADGSRERDLTVWEDMPEDDTSIWSPFRIQINDFEGEGLAIGLSCTHMSADPTCYTTFFKSWIEVDRGVSITHPPFFHPPGLRSRVCPNTNT
ncbi:protein ECERIFERUM 26-like, partial [Macadamia integrifolia]|uniref:protein ECERIFERUM 26-like n=1 Tax=Macadamia integrifolia TaxID=60698 RepID=UPI001C4E5434